MVSSSTNSFLLLLFPLLVLLVAPTTPAPAGPAEKYDKWCQAASDGPSCNKVIQSIPAIQQLGENERGTLAVLCLHLAAKKATEAKGAADTMLAAAKDKPSSCLKYCAANIDAMAEVLVPPPIGKDSLCTFIQPVRAKFRYQRPPDCDIYCWRWVEEKPWMFSADETGIINKFHDIWTLVQVGNYQLLNCDDGDDIL